MSGNRETPRIRPQDRPACATLPEGHPAMVRPPLAFWRPSPFDFAAVKPKSQGASIGAFDIAKRFRKILAASRHSLPKNWMEHLGSKSAELCQAPKPRLNANEEVFGAPFLGALASG
jgi:hypothetical protein